MDSGTNVLKPQEVSLKVKFTIVHFVADFETEDSFNSLKRERDSLIQSILILKATCFKLKEIRWMELGKCLTP